MNPKDLKEFIETNGKGYDEHKKFCCGDMTWICVHGKCETSLGKCHMRSVCDQPCSYYDGHEEEMIEALCLTFRYCVAGLKAHMVQKGYNKLSDFRGNTAETWLKDVL